MTDAAAAEVVQLDVGGQRFAASRGTLAAGGPDSFLGALCSGRWEPGDAQSIDRDPVFSHALQHLRVLRDGLGPLSAHTQALCQLSAAQLEKLHEEADLYGLLDLAAACAAIRQLEGLSGDSRNGSPGAAAAGAGAAAQAAQPGAAAAGAAVAGGAAAGAA